MSPPIAEEATLRAYRAEMRSLLASRVRNAWALCLLLTAASCVLGWVYFPERSQAIIVLLSAFAFIGVFNIIAVRERPTWTVPVTLVATVAMVFCFSIYLVHVHGLAELCVIGLILFLAGLVVMLPWGTWEQAVLGFAALIGYLLALTGGVVPALPLPYGIFALVVAAIITTLGAHFLDSYRFSAFHHAIESQRANAAKSEFLATVSHELRTPLNIIVGYTDLLIDGAITPPEEQTETLLRIRQQSSQLLNLIQAMLDINRLEAGGIALVLSEFRIADVFENLRSSLPPSWGKDGVQLDWPLTDQQIVMRSDRNKIETIVRNLVHNALKYTQHGSVTVTAIIEPRASHLRLAVADTGEGILAEDLPLIFNMFSQGSSGPPRGGGVGLGLFIVERFTTALGGTVSVDSQHGAGTCVTVSLPLEVPSARQ